MTKPNPHIGSSLDDFLAEENLLTKSEEAANTRITDWQQAKAIEPQQGNEFWNGLQKLRATIEREGIIFDDNDFADLRDRLPGREINLQRICTIYLSQYKLIKDMSTNTLRYSPEEFAAKGTKIYQEQVLPNLNQDFDGKIVAIDIETGEFELADTTLAAAAKMFDRIPDAQLWFERIGAQSVHRFNSVYPA